MAENAVKYLERLLRQATRETDQSKLDKIVAEIYRVVAERDKRRAQPKSRTG